MARISDLSDELLVKILSFLPTARDAVSTSILSKQWEFLWLWLPNLKFYRINDSVIDFINKNLPLHRAPTISTFCLDFHNDFLQPETFKPWVEVAVSRAVRELTITSYLDDIEKEQTWYLFFPGSLYTCSSLITLELQGPMIFVDVPATACLPSLKSLKLIEVTYSNENSLRLLLSNCPVLEHLTIERRGGDNLRALIIITPSLQRLSLKIDQHCSDDRSEIYTPSLKYFKVVDDRSNCAYVIEHMAEMEKASINLYDDKNVEQLLKPITTVKRLSLCVGFSSGNETVYGDGIVFGQLENLKLTLGEGSVNWSKILFQLLKDSPILQILDIEVDGQVAYASMDRYKPVHWSNEKSSVPKCLLKSLKTVRFDRYYSGDKEYRDFLSYIIKHGRRLEPSSIVLCSKT